LTIRQRVGLALMLNGQYLLGRLSGAIIGKDLTPEVMQEFIGDLKSRMPENLGQLGAQKGLARESQELEALFAKGLASLHPNSQWTFSKREVGPLVLMIMPRIIDSNTALVMSSSSRDVKAGDIITLDNEPPNCDPAALAQFTAPPDGLVDAEFMEPK
jgi:hypothetical protein